jgi:ribulose 1,5-bisphosphate synthetase/thiazole synthase
MVGVRPRKLAAILVAFDFNADHDHTALLVSSSAWGNCMTSLAPDVVIVGGGIAGGTMATVLARNGLEVTVLERQAILTECEGNGLLLGALPNSSGSGLSNS